MSEIINNNSSNNEELQTLDTKMIEKDVQNVNKKTKKIKKQKKNKYVLDQDEELLIDKDNNYSIKDITMLKKFGKYLRPYLGRFIFHIFMLIVSTFVITLEPFLYGRLISILSEHTQPDVMYAVLFYSAIYLVLIVFFLITLFYNNYGLYKVGQDIVYDIRTDIFAHIELLGIGQINSLPIGKFVTRVTNDTQSLSRFFTDILVTFSKDIITVIAVLVFTFIMEWRLALIMCAFVPIVFGISAYTRITAKKKFRLIRNSFSNLNAFMAENLSGMSTIQIFNQEERKGEEFDKINDRLERRFLNLNKLWAIYHPSMYVLSMACAICILGVGIPLVLNRVIEPAVLFSFYQYVFWFFNPIQQIAGLFNQLANILSSTEKICSVLDIEHQITDKEDSIEVSSFKGEIEFKDVWFSYTNKEDDWVLKGVSFKIKPGQTAAFVGQTGSGKSTIIGLIVRNYQIQKGEILIDGINVNNIKIESLRKCIGEMLQDVFLFSGTIAENISLANPNVPREDIEKACQYVGADSFINRLQNKYDEEVRERGNNFSTGQRQLISFSRVVLYKPSIIILDEATANIDTETEVIIQKSLAKMRNIGTMIMVAHRLSTIKSADVIFVIDSGKIIESGNHESLIKNKGPYYNFYKLQSTDEEREEIIDV